MRAGRATARRKRSRKHRRTARGDATSSIPLERSRGRRYPELAHPYRNPFQRDRDRVIECATFLQRARFALARDEEPTPVASVTLIPKGGMPLKVSMKG